jgi:hypothetical protein
MTDGPWWVDSLATVAGIAIGAWMIVWQQRDSKRSELKLTLFEELRAGLKRASEAASKASMYAFNARMNVLLYRAAIARGEHLLPATCRFPAFMPLHSEACNRIADLQILLEGHDIVSKDFELFRQALGCTASDANDVYMKMVPFLIRTWPIDLPAGTKVPEASDKDIEMMEKGCLAYWEVLTTITSFVYDISIESQNLLLGGIFRRRASPRTPADPRIWVLRTNDRAYLQKLQKHFFVDHPAAAKQRMLGVAAATRALSENATA